MLDQTLGHDTRAGWWSPSLTVAADPAAAVEAGVGAEQPAAVAAAAAGRIASNPESDLDTAAVDAVLLQAGSGAG